MSCKAALLAIWLAGLSLAVAQSPRPVWSPAELRTLASLSIDSLGPPPADSSNRVADDPRAAELGRLLFNDRRLSGNGKVSCGTCHDPARGFTDRTPLGQGMATGNRRTMPIGPAVWSPWHFWDGRADSLWAQALGPIENPVEHGFTRSQMAGLIGAHYARRYALVFGPLPLSIRQGERASPLGDVAARRNWAAIPAARQAAIDRVFVNGGKAIAAFERTQRMPRTRFDAYVASLGSGARGASPLSGEEIAGLRLFIGKGNCTTCHSGPLLTNHEFANTGVPVRPGQAEDRGRVAGIAKAKADPFNCRGRFNDAAHPSCAELDFAVSGAPEQVRAYKVPSLRGVALRPPYMHAGQFATLGAVIDHYARAPAAPAGRSQLKPLALDAAERRSLIAFLATLNPATGRK